MDSGAIYTWTQNDGIIIRYNYIHDYTGAGDNRGIFCDDGSGNLSIYGNAVLNTPNSYSIDSRRAKDQKAGLRNNNRNFMAYNVVDNGVRFMGYSLEERHCRKGSNLVLSNNKDKNVSNQFDKIERMDEDLMITSWKYKKNFTLKHILR
ncbi:MAG: hypothetical protein IJ628_11260 [Bacteroidaceae bacterium]|nr:hypothetical protein [Bacteroidaceae bacterium]